MAIHLVSLAGDILGANRAELAMLGEALVTPLAELVQGRRPAGISGTGIA